MRTPLLVLVLIILSGCDNNELEGFVFKKSLESKLVERCGEKDRLCITAVKQQTGKCADKADWGRFLEDSEDPAEKQRFQGIFFKCLVDVKGKPFFEL